MRIGIDARLWEQTGVGRYLQNLVEGLAKIDNENEYVLFFKQHAFDTVTLPGINFSKCLANIHWHSFAEQVQFPKILNNAQVDLMHFPYFSVPYFYKKPFVVTIHDLIIHHFATGKASTKPSLVYFAKVRGYKFLMQYAATHAQKIIAVSHTTKNEIIDHLAVNAHTIEVIYEGVVVNKEKEVHLPKQLQNVPYFLYVGNAYPHKNLERLLLAFSNLGKEQSTIQLVLVGKQDFFYNRLEQEIQRLGLAQHVFHLKHVLDNELGALYKHAKAVVVPSLMEGFGLPILEGMAYGTLVIASNIPAFTEIGQKQFISIDPYSVSDITNRLLDVLVHANKYEYLKALGKKHAALFSWETMAQKTKAIYESCISA